MEQEIRCSCSWLQLTLCVVTGWKWVSKKKFFFFRETSTSPLVPFRANFQPIGQIFLPRRPLAYSLHIMKLEVSIIYSGTKPLLYYFHGSCIRFLVCNMDWFGQCLIFNHLLRNIFWEISSVLSFIIISLYANKLLGLNCHSNMDNTWQ